MEQYAGAGRQQDGKGIARDIRESALSYGRRALHLHECKFAIFPQNRETGRNYYTEIVEKSPPIANYKIFLGSRVTFRILSQHLTATN